MNKIMILAKDLALTGELRTQGSVRLEGHFEGSGIIKGTLLIATEASWGGTLVADLVIVRGVLRGEVTAERIILLEGARATGLLLCSKIHIQRGAFFTGTLRMRSAQNSSVDPATSATIHPLPNTKRQVARR